MKKTRSERLYGKSWNIHPNTNQLLNQGTSRWIYALHLVYNTTHLLWVSPFPESFPGNYFWCVFLGSSSLEGQPYTGQGIHVPFFPTSLLISWSLNVRHSVALLDGTGLYHLVLWMATQGISWTVTHTTSNISSGPWDTPAVSKLLDHHLWDGCCSYEKQGLYYILMPDNWHTFHWCRTWRPLSLSSCQARPELLLLYAEQNALPIKFFFYTKGGTHCATG